MAMMIKVCELSKTYDGKHYTPSRLSFAADSQQRMIFIDGPNGCGKTTLLKLISGEELPTTGIIQQSDEKSLTLIYQRDGLLPEISAYDNLRMIGCQDEDIVSTTARLGLASSTLHQKAKLLSGGEERRVQLARTLLSRRRVWLLDEPTSHADVELKKLMCQYIVANLISGGMVVLVSHDPVLRASLTDQLHGICEYLVVTLNVS